MSYKTLFNENKPNVGILKNSHVDLLYTVSEISKDFQETFLEGKHQHKQTFDESMEKTVNSFCNGCLIPSLDQVLGRPEFGAR